MPGNDNVVEFEAGYVIEESHDLMEFRNGMNVVALVPKTCLVICNE